jgi:hypothetical protein
MSSWTKGYIGENQVEPGLIGKGVDVEQLELELG